MSDSFEVLAQAVGDNVLNDVLIVASETQIIISKIVITETADGISQNFLNSGQLLTDAVWHWLNSNYVSHNSASSLFDHVAVTPSGGRS